MFAAWCVCPDQVPADQCIMLASAVSSTALGAMAGVEGFRFEQTLTGFKWLGNIAKQRQAQGLKVLFAFEEAIGFMFPDVGMVSVVAAANACSDVFPVNVGSFRMFSLSAGNTNTDSI